MVTQQHDADVGPVQPVVSGQVDGIGHGDVHAEDDGPWAGVGGQLLAQVLQAADRLGVDQRGRHRGAAEDEGHGAPSWKRPSSVTPAPGVITEVSVSSPR